MWWECPADGRPDGGREWPGVAGRGPESQAPLHRLPASALLRGAPAVARCASVSVWYAVVAPRTSRRVT